MTSLLTLVKELPWPIAAGWVLALAWGIAQVVWFRRARVEAPVVQPPAPRRVRPRRLVAHDARTDSAAVPAPSVTIDHEAMASVPSSRLDDALPPIDLDATSDTSFVTPNRSVLGLN